MASLDAGELLTLLLHAAESIGATVERAAEQIQGDRFNSEVLSDAISGNTVRRHGSELPSFVKATLLDKFPVLFGVLSGPPHRASVSAQLTRYRNQATIARSWLGEGAPNLHLFLACQADGGTFVEWRQLAAEIEADDRVCRKLVWIFTDKPTVEIARHFLERTFVARPWPVVPRSEQLDSAANFSLPTGWETALHDPELDFTSLVERLIELQRRPVA